MVSVPFVCSHIDPVQMILALDEEIIKHRKSVVLAWTRRHTVYHIPPGPVTVLVCVGGLKKYNSF